jgi:hypothetical protein
MKISLSDVVVAFLLATSLSLVVIPQPKPFPHWARHRCGRCGNGSARAGGVAQAEAAQLAMTPCGRGQWTEWIVGFFGSRSFTVADFGTASGLARLGSSNGHAPRRQFANQFANQLRGTPWNGA